MCLCVPVFCMVLCLLVHLPPVPFVPSDVSPDTFPLAELHLHSHLSALKCLQTRIGLRNQPSFHLNDKRLHPAFNKLQIPESILIKVFDYQFPSNPRPRPSVATADMRSGCSQRGGIPPHFWISAANTDSRFLMKQKVGTQICVPCKHNRPWCILS